MAEEATAEEATAAVVATAAEAATAKAEAAEVEAAAAVEQRRRRWPWRRPRRRPDGGERPSHRPW